MPKKLLALISVENKSNEQIFDEIQAVLSKRKQGKKSENRRYYCPKCSAQLTKVPISSYTNGQGTAISIPHFGKAKCDNCKWQSEPYGRGLISNPTIPK